MKGLLVCSALVVVSSAFAQYGEIIMRPPTLPGPLQIGDAHETRFSGLHFTPAGRHPVYWSDVTPSAGASVLPPGAVDFTGIRIAGNRVTGGTAPRDWLLTGPGSPAQFNAGFFVYAPTVDFFFGSSFSVPAFTTAPAAAPSLLPMPAGYTQGRAETAWGNLAAGQVTGPAVPLAMVVWRNGAILTTSPNADVVDQMGAAFSVDRTNSPFTDDVTDYGYVTPPGVVGYIPTPAGWDTKDVFPGMVMLQKGGAVELVSIDGLINPLEFWNTSPGGTGFDARSLSTDGAFWYAGGYRFISGIASPVVRVRAIELPPTSGASGVYETKFPSPTFVPGNLNGQQLWTVFPTSASSSFLVGSGRPDGTLGVVVPSATIPAGSSYIYRPITYEAASTVNKVISGSANVRIRGNALSSPTVTTAGVSVYQGPTELARLMMDPRGYLTLTSGTNTGTTLEYGLSDNWMRLTLEVDFQNNRVRGYVNGVPYGFSIALGVPATGVTDFDLTVTGGGSQDVQFDDFVVKTGLPTKRVRLLAQPLDHVAPNGVPLTWNVSVDGTPLVTNRVSPFPYLNLELPQSASSITFSADGQSWLRRRATRTLPSGESSYALLLPNGDADGSGEVDLTDIDLIISRYLTTNAQADIDGSGEVDLSDVDIAISNYLLADD